MNRTLGAVAPGVQIWAGEVGPHNGGSPGCSTGGRWANWGNTFWCLDAMGSKARNGYSAFCRQDFIGIDHGMLDCKTQAPLPDYHGGVLWSSGMLMGRSVLSVTGAAPLAGRRIRACAHCANTTPGAVTVLLLNTDAVAGAGPAPAPADDSAEPTRLMTRRRSSVSATVDPVFRAPAPTVIRAMSSNAKAGMGIFLIFF